MIVTNNTAGDLYVEGILFPASGTITVSDSDYLRRLARSDAFRGHLSADELRIDIGAGVLSTADALAYFDNDLANAERAPYDNTVSGLIAQNVQDAIDENAAAIASVGMATPNEVWVNSALGNDTNSGLRGSPVATMSEAIARAKAYKAVQGSVTAPYDIYLEAEANTPYVDVDFNIGFVRVIGILNGEFMPQMSNVIVSLLTDAAAAQFRTDGGASYTIDAAGSVTYTGAALASRTHQTEYNSDQIFGGSSLIRIQNVEFIDVQFISDNASNPGVTVIPSSGSDASSVSQSVMFTNCRFRSSINAGTALIAINQYNLAMRDCSGLGHGNAIFDSCSFSDIRDVFSLSSETAWCRGKSGYPPAFSLDLFPFRKYAGVWNDGDLIFDYGAGAVTVDEAAIDVLRCSQTLRFRGQINFGDTLPSIECRDLVVGDNDAVGADPTILCRSIYVEDTITVEDSATLDACDGYVGGDVTVNGGTVRVANVAGDVVAAVSTTVCGFYYGTTTANVVRDIGDFAGVDDRAYILNHDSKVPSSGTQYLRAGMVPTSAAPIVVPAGGTITRASISVDDADAGNDYDFEILVNGSVVETIALLSGANSAVSSVLSSSVVAGDEISARLVRTAGTGKSDFDNITATIHVTD